MRIDAGAKRREMQIAMSNALALLSVQEFRFLQDFNSRDFTWMLIGALLAGVVMLVISRRRRRWL